MSYDEYLDLFKFAKENNDAKYYVVSFDVVDSKKISYKQRAQLNLNMNGIIKYVYNKLNLASWKIMEKLGFKFIGTKKFTYFKDDDTLPFKGVLFK